MGVIEFLLALAQDMILAAIPAVGFAMVFNVPVRALRWCALLGAIGHGSRMILMTSGLNIEWSTFMASMLVGTIGIQWSRWYLAHPKVFTVAFRYPYVPGHIGLYRNDFGGKNQPVRLQRTVDDYPVNQLSYSFIDCWCVIHRSFHSWIMVVPQAPSRIKLPRLSTRMRDSLLSSVCYYKSYLPSRSSFHI